MAKKMSPKMTPMKGKMAAAKEERAEEMAGSKGKVPKRKGAAKNVKK